LSPTLNQATSGRLALFIAAVSIPVVSFGTAIAEACRMINGIFSTIGSKSANERRLEIVSSNLANALTPGFKAIRPVFTVTPVGEPDNPDQLQQTYVNITDTYVHFSDAPLIQTGNSFDLALEGSGFFVISTSNGNMYTRNGQFTLDSEKRLVTTNGNPVVGEGGGEITIDGKDVKIEVDGSVYVDGARIDSIKVVDFADKKPLRNVGQSLFTNTDEKNAETTATDSSVRQGAYEASNVDVMKEMVELISALRAYETYTKVDQMTSDVLDRLIEMGKY
jgi:flagellar basal-body rod protein FlgF